MADKKLTPLYLKTAAEKFDLETIFILDLSDKNIQGGIGSLGECTNLMHLNLSKNRITMLTGMDTCISLTVLDLSFNKLTSIDALKGCVNLETLDLRGNLIKDLKPIERVAPSLQKMTSIYLQGFTGEDANPCCSGNVYKPGMCKSFPKLSALDGQRLAVGWIDMKDLGIELNEEEEDLEYQVDHEPFYSEEITDNFNFNSNKVKLGDAFKKEATDFDKLLADCEAKLNTKTHILKL